MVYEVYDYTSTVQRAVSVRVGITDALLLKCERILSVLTEHIFHKKENSNC